MRTKIGPLYDNAMGGIILLSEPVEENISNYALNISSMDILTGYASNDANASSDKKRGSKNLTESKLLDNGYQYVWDFGTSQGNGSISAVCLTDAETCKNGYTILANPESIGSVYLDERYSELETNFVHYDFNKNIATCITQVDETTIKVKKFTIAINTLYLTSGIRTKVTKITEQNVECSGFKNGGTWTYGHDGYYYYFCAESQNKQYLARMNKDTLRVDESFGIKEINANYDVSRLDVFCVTDGYLYIMTDNGKAKAFSKINISDPSDIIQYDESFTAYYGAYANKNQVFSDGNVFLKDNTVFHYNYSGENYCRGFYNKVYYEEKYIPTYIADDNELIRIDTGDSKTALNFGYFRNNVCTINNLGNTLVKTADKTMKITYTITEE
uniref:hypothetical protein n=1 Tax=Agathobacter sp. TaxID=2021311 RepID=UPI004028C426